MNNSISCRNANSQNISNIKIPWTGQLLNRHYNIVMYHVNRNKQDTVHIIPTARVCLCASTLLWSHLHGFPVYSSCNSLRPGSWGAMMGCRSLLSSQCVTPPYRHRQLRNTHRRHGHCLCVTTAVTLWLRWHQHITSAFMDSWVHGRYLYIWFMYRIWSTHSRRIRERHTILNLVCKCVRVCANDNAFGQKHNKTRKK